MMTKVMYLRIDDEIHDAVKTLAAEAHVSINFVAEVLIRRGLGQPYDGSANPLHRLLTALEKPR